MSKKEIGKRLSELEDARTLPDEIKRRADEINDLLRAYEIFKVSAEKGEISAEDRAWLVEWLRSAPKEIRESARREGIKF